MLYFIEVKIAYRSLRLVYHYIVRRCREEVGMTIDVHWFGVHLLRAVAVMKALADGADIVKVREWPGHTNVSTTRIYDKRKMRAKQSPTFKVEYGKPAN